MFTPQRRQSSAITLTPRSEVRKSGGTNVPSSNPKFGGKGKAVAFVDGPMPSPPPPPPPFMSLSGDDAMLQADNMEDWMRFREAGLLDEAVMERKDRQALLDKASRLEKELFDYQYAMGLLLIEKKEWNSKYDELSQALAEVQEIFRRDQAAHIIAYSEAEEREENFRKALSVEKQKATELQRVLRDLQQEHTQIKHASDSNLTDAKALAVGMEDRSLEVEARVCAAGAKLDELNHKNSELDRKLEEVEARENVLQRERLSLKAEKEAHEATFYKQRQDLLEWEMKLRKGEDRLCELQKTLNHKEERANENERVIEQKGKGLEETEKNITLSFTKLREKEDDIKDQLSDLAVKEKEADNARRVLETEERDLLALEKKLSAREKMEVQEILDEHRVALDVKMQELELELEKKKKDLDEELRSKVAAMGQHEVEILHREEKLRKREQALDKKSERVREKEKDIELKLKSVKATQKSVNAEQKKLELEQRKLLADRESLLTLKNECEKIRSEISQQELQTNEESENLKIASDERLEHIRMQAELKLELEKCRLQEDFLTKEGEELRGEREKFEKELEVLEGKSDQLSKELKEITKEREKFEKLRHNEKEKMKKKKNKMEEYIQKEMEALRLEKESFELRKRHEQLALSEKAETLHDQMVQDFESQRISFGTDSRSRKEEMEKDLLERERSFKIRGEKELKDLMYLKEVAEKELEKIQSDRRTVEKEKHEVAKSKEELERQQFGMRKDIGELVTLSDRLRVQREQVVRERNHFITFVEKHKGCKKCGDITREFILSDLLPPDIEDRELAFLQGQADKILRNNQEALGAPVDVDSSQHELDSKSGERVSWFRKCTSKIFNISPSKKIEHVSASISAEEKPDVFHAARGSVGGHDTELFFGTTNDFTVHGIKVEGDGCTMSFNDQSHIDSKPEDCGLSELKGSQRKPGRRRRLSRTRSVKEVVDDAKLFLGKGSGVVENSAENIQPNDNNHISDESRGISLHTDKLGSNVIRKRDRGTTESEQGAGDSDGCSDSVTTFGRRKRRQIVAPVVTPGQKRYNLRRQKTASTVKTEEKEIDDSAAAEPRAIPETASALSFGFGAASGTGKSTDLVNVTTVKKDVDVLQDREYGLNSANIVEQAEEVKSVEITELSEEVNGGTECGEDDNGSKVYEEEDEEDDEDEDEEDDDDDDDLYNPDEEASMRKKIWTFFTS
ncbi:nuclear matrix constituent protein 1 [Euphorbia lathyris]|uniref:nuclear matrix constituent protein 1 n=1 Tax=Euphorbia lathyris TaxID=212925 RepID=UPI0033138BB9